MIRSMRIWALAIFSSIGLPPANTESCRRTLREVRRRSPTGQKYRCRSAFEREGESMEDSGGKGEDEG